MILRETHYDPRTPASMCHLLERIRLEGIRVRFHWGDVKTGRDWGDRWNVRGTIGRSMGPMKVPILLYNRRSRGGVHILDHCIVKIVTTKGKRVLYQHPKYHEVTDE